MGSLSVITFCPLNAPAGFAGFFFSCDFLKAFRQCVGLNIPHTSLYFSISFSLSLLFPLSLNSHFVFLLSELCERVQLCVSVSVCIALNGLGWLVMEKKHH